MDPAGHFKRKGIGQIGRGNEGILRENIFFYNFTRKDKKKKPGTSS